MNTYHFFVGSSNPVKVNAVKQALTQDLADAEVTGFEVPSGVSSQPMTDEETKQGATNRARAAWEKGKAEVRDQQSVFGIGLEGGVFQNPAGELWTTVWVLLIAPDGSTYEANGSRIRVPQVIADQLLSGGEMGPVVQQLTGLTNLKQKQGMFGVITQGFVNRTEEYANIAKIAIGLWYGRDWDKMLPL